MSEPNLPTVTHNPDPLRTTADNPTTPESTPAIRPSDLVLPSTTGRYSILREVGRGGMGAVLLGRDEEMGRDLAIKVLHSQTASPEAERRFLEEARLSGRLQHPGIVPVYEMGRFDDERPYFTMKLVQGRTLKALLEERKSPADDLPRFLKVFEQICQTMAYAHSRRVIHRDLKPHNVMVGEFGEVQVMDWGLAKALNRDDTVRMTDDKPPEMRTETAPHETQAGVVLGTLSYMSPEQARGDIDLLDERTDVFGLGAILCEILTGRPPFIGEKRDEIWLRASNGDLREPFARLDRSGTDAELVALAKACLAGEAPERLRDASAVSQAVTAYLSGVQERLRSAEIERAAAQARAVEAKAKAKAERRSRQLTMGLAAAVILVGVLVGGGWIWAERQQAEIARQQAEMARQRLEIEDSVNIALQEAIDLHNQAREAKNRGNWIAVSEAMKKAEALASNSQVGPALRQRVETARANATVDQQQQDQEYRLVNAVDNIHRRILEEPFDGRHQFWLRSRDFNKLFLDAALDLDRLSLTDAAEALRDRPVPVTVALVSALDQWTFVEWAGFWEDLRELTEKTPGWQALSRLVRFRLGRVAGDFEKWRRRIELSRLIDPDPFRKKLREALVRFDLDQFKQLLRTNDAEKLPGPTVQVAATILIWLGEAQQASVLLRKGADRNPFDWTLLTLLGDLHMGWLPRGYPGGLPQPTLVADYPEAAAWFRRTVLPSSQDGRNAFRLAEALIRSGKTDEGAEVLQQLLKANSGSPKLNYSLGMLLFSRGDLDGAIPYLTFAAQRAPNNPQYVRSLGLAFKEKKDWMKAASYFAAAIRLAPTNTDYHLELGLLLEEQGIFSSAATEFKEVVRLNKNLPDVWVRLGKVLKKMNRRGEALEAFRQGAAPGTANANAHHALGMELVEQFEMEGGIVALREAVRQAPEWREAHADLVAVLTKIGKIEEAMTVGQAMLKRWPNDETARAAVSLGLQQLGDQQAVKNQITDAITSYRKAIELQSENGLAWMGLGYVLSMNGQRPEAIDALKRAHRLRPEDKSLLSNLGWMYLQADMIDEAIGAFEGAATSKDDPNPHRGMAQILLRRGNLDRAITSMENALKIQPKDFSLLCDYADALRRKNRLPEAVTAARSAIKLQPENLSGYSILGQVLVDQGEWKDAPNTFRDSMRKSKSMVTGYQIADVLYRRDSVDEAITYLTNPAELWPTQTAGAYTAMLWINGKEKELQTCCAAMVKAYGSTRAGYDAFWTARCLTQSPGSGVNPAEAVKLAEVAVAFDTTWGGAYGVLGLAHYRAGEYEKAIELVNESLRKGGYPSIGWLILALAHERLGKREAAQQWLEKAIQDPGTLAMNPQDKGFYELLRREAEPIMKTIR